MVQLSFYKVQERCVTLRCRRLTLRSAYTVPVIVYFTMCVGVLYVIQVAKMLIHLSVQEPGDNCKLHRRLC
jgi:hypothetical protein